MSNADRNAGGVEALNAAVALVTSDNPRAGGSSVQLREGDYHAFATETQDVQPGRTVTWYVYGPPGDTVRFQLERVGSSGGHEHPNDARKGPFGSGTPTTTTLNPNYPQNQPVVFTAPDAAGIVKVTWLFSSGTQEADYMRVLVPDLVAFSGGTGIILTGGTSTHPDSHYGIRALNEKIEKLGKQFHDTFSKNIYVNDMSLQHGGLFDHKATWRPPHRTHRDGRRVDINSTSMSESEKESFRLFAKEIGFRTIRLETDPEHWHLEV